MRTTSSDGTSAVAGTPLDAAITSPERTIRGRLEVDWDKTGFSGSQYYGQVPSFDDTFTGGSLDPRWTLAGAGAVFDSVNHQVVLPNIIGTNTGAGSPQTTTGGTSLTLAQNFDMHGATLRFKFTMPTLASTTRRMDIYIVDRDTGDYWYARQDSGGLYIQTYNFSTVAPLSKVATWQNANLSFVSKQIDLSFTGDCNPTAVFTPVTGGSFTALPFNTAQLPVPPPRLNNCRIVITAFSTAAEAAANTTIQEVLYAGSLNTDNVTSASDHLEIDRSLQGTLPDQVQIIEGSSVAQIQGNLTTGETVDERLDAAWKFSPFNTNSPLHTSPVLGVGVRASVDVETASGTKSFQKAIGSLQNFDVNVSAGEAPLVAYDYRNKLAGNVQIPPIDGGIFGLNATAIVDYALASGGVNIGPPIQPTATLWAPMHGSAYPMVSGRSAPTFGRYFFNNEAEPITALGYTKNVDAGYRPLFINGPFYNATTNPSSKGLLAGGGSALLGYGIPSTTTQMQYKCFFAPDTTRGNMFSQTNAKGVINLWVKGDTFSGTLDSSSKMVAVWFQAAYNRNQKDMGIGIYIGASRELGISYWTSTNVLAGVAPFATLPSDGAWHNIGVSWDASGATLNVAGSMDGSPSGITAVPSWDPTLLPLTDTWIPNCWFHTYLPIAEVQAYAVSNIDTKCGYPNANSFIQNTRVDYSSLELAGNIDTSQREAWDLVTEIAATEAAAAYFDEDGVFQYRTRSRLVDTTHQTVQKTVTANESLKSLKISQALDTVRNTITANVVPLNSTRNVVVFATTDTFVLPANKKTQLTFEFSNPTTNLWMVQPGSSTKGPYTPVYWDNVYPWPDPNQSGFGIPHGMACARSAQTGGTVRGMPFPTVVYMDAKTITLEFTNPYSSVTYITNDGQNANSLITYTMFGGGTTYDKVMQYWGSPSIMLVGDMLTAGSPQPITYVEPYSVSQYGTQVLPLTDSQWRQDTTTALGLVGQVAADLSVPFPVATVTAIGDPRLQLDDRVKLQAGDYDGISTNPLANSDFWIQGITDTITPDGGYEQSLVLRGATTVMKWASTLADTDKGYLTINPTNKWDRYTWG
jgi:hypothetical protein